MSAGIGSAAAAALEGVSPPGHGSKVFKSECAFSFVTPEDADGLFVNLRTFVGVSKEFLDSDCAATGFPGGEGAYLHVRWTRVVRSGDGDGTEAAAPLTKVAIGVDGGAPSESVTFEKHHALVMHPSGHRLDLPDELPCDSLPPAVNEILERVIEHDDASKQEEVKASAWEQKIEVSGFAPGLPVVDSPPKISPNPKDWECFRCGMKENLWLNLSTGVIGCGRRQYDGSGGNSHAFEHFNETGKVFPLCVKLGTITPDGADVFSYHPSEDDLVEDPMLADHLVRFGIDIMKMRKTDKTMGELQLDLNNRLELDSLTEEGSILTPATGPGLIGLRNLGNSCYINSCLQALSTMPEFRRRYLAHADSILRSVPAPVAVSDLTVQLAKIAVALGTDKYVVDDDDSDDGDSGASPPTPPGEDASAEAKEAYKTAMEKKARLTAVAPRMFRALAGKGHPEFSTTKQQDAMEYFEHLLGLVDKAERKERAKAAAGSDVFAAHEGKLSALFAFETEARLECLTSHTVRYKTSKAASMTLPIVEEAATNKAEVEAAKAAADAKETAETEPKSARTASGATSAGSAAASGSTTSSSSTSSSSSSEVEIPVLSVPFQACLDAWGADSFIPDLRSGATGDKGPHSQRSRFARFPPYLLLQMRRYTVGDDWKPVKVTAKVEVPEVLDLTHLRAPGGIQPGEKAMPETEDAQDGGTSDGGGGGAAATAADAAIVAQLMGLGLASENACKRAAVAVSNTDVGAAASWLMEHMGDADINDPLEEEGGGGGGTGTGSEPPAEAVVQLVSMGCKEEHAKVALAETGNNAERAVDWIFSRDPAEIDAIIASKAQQEAAEAAAATGPAVEVSADWDGKDGAGVYELFAVISHLGKTTGGGHYVAHVKKNGVWCIFNDRKVAVSKAPPLALGYMYFFRRADMPGSTNDPPGAPVARGEDHPVNRGATGAAAASSSSSSSSSSSAAAAVEASGTTA